MTKAKAHPVFENGIPNTYDRLFMEHPLRPIHDEVAHENALEIVQALAGLNLNADQEDYLEVLGTLVNEYEGNNLDTLPNAKPLEALKFLVADRKMSTRELGRVLGKDESLGSKILAGERSITPEHAVKLAKHFAVRPELFLNLSLD
jgi:HTH-type transcriptional regulator / antitoxin HigA